MKKATFTITGEGIRETILEATADFQQDEYVARYDFGAVSVFMFEQYKTSTPNFALNVIIDFSIEPTRTNEIRLECIAMGAKNRHEINWFDLEKSLLGDFRAHFFGYRDRHDCQWEISDLAFFS